ncbi:MAG TPA: polymer-forming cytoskeletal protein [Burkholderiales bacterium]
MNAEKNQTLKLRFVLRVFTPSQPSRRHLVTGFMLACLMPLLATAQQSEKMAGRHETVIAGDYFGAGSNLTPGTPVEGDAFIAGGQVSLQTAVAGDAVLSGGTVEISAPVGDDLYASGVSVVLESTVNGNARLAGGNVEIAKSANVAGKATIAGRTVRVLGKVGHQLAVFGDRVMIDGHVAGNVTIAARSLEVGPNARITGKLTYRGPAEPVIETGAVISGGTNHPEVDFDGDFQPLSQVAGWTLAIAFTVGLFFLGLLGIVSGPVTTSKVGQLVRSRQFACLGIGLVMILCMPLAALVLAMTVVGIPLAFVLAMLWPVMLIFGYLAGVMSVTDAIVGARPRKLPGSGLRAFMLALGLAGMLAFCSVPLIGWVLGVVLTIAGVGAMALQVFSGHAYVVRPQGDEVVFRREPTFRF